MCSRNGTPIEIFDRPAPSSESFTRTSVSFVLRQTSAEREFSVLLFTTDLPQSGQQLVVLLRPANADAKIILQHRIAAHVANQNVAQQQLFKHHLRLDLRLDQHEITFR